MPLSELLPAAARQKRGPFQQTMSAVAAANCSSDLSPLVPDQDFVELLWENGQIVMQGQSHRASKSSSPPSLPSFSGRPGGVPADFSGKELAAGGYLGHPGFANQDAEMPPWPNYRIEDYSLDFLAEFTSSSPSSLPATVPGAQLSTPPPTEALQLSPKSRSREPVFSSAVDLLPGRTQKHDEHAGPGAANFSHFLRPAAAPAKAAPPPDHSLPSFDIRASENASAAASSNPPESTLIDPVSCSRSLSSFHGDSAPGGMAWADDNQEDSSRFPSRIDTANPPRPSAETSGLKSSSLAGAAAGEKLHEPVATSPSMCSASCKRKLKNQDGDDSECHSEDVEDESAEAKKPSPSAKRSRAAEVHNLSERKRRDRINEKLRALQELIPNCSKVDKASVLDEAIEYLKSLQMQLRIMSTGGGMYMPPMIVPPGMQASPMGPFSSMGLGMGFGMGVIDSNGYPFVPPPPLPYPCAAIPPPGTQRGMLGHTTFRTYGAPPMPVPIPRSHAAFIPMAAPPMKVNGPAEMTTEASHAGGTE